MPSFKDTEGRVWTLRITVAAIRRIKDIAGIDLGDFSVFGEGGPFSDLGSDSCRLVEIVYAAVKPEADIIGVTMEKFMESLYPATAMRFALLVLNDCLGDRCVGFHIHARCGCGLKTQRRRVIEPRNTLESRAVGLSPGSSGSGNARRRYRVYLWFYSCPYGGRGDS